MSAIGSTNSYASDLPSLLFTHSSDSSQAASPGAPDAGAGSSHGHATRIDLSDKIKHILARASSDQDVADRLKAFVESHRFNGTDSSAQDGSSSTAHGFDVNKGFAQLSGTWGDDSSQDDAPVDVTKNFATGLKAGGYTISAIGRASDGSFQIQIVGPDGNSFLDRRFGTTGEFSTFGGIGPGEAAQSYQRGNKEYITFSESEAAAVNVTATSPAGTLSATSVGTHTASTTFVVDFSTGAISMLQSEATSVSTTAQVAVPGSAYSTVA
jgi:hypothetical protein